MAEAISTTEACFKKCALEDKVLAMFSSSSIGPYTYSIDKFPWNILDNLEDLHRIIDALNLGLAQLEDSKSDPEQSL